MPLILHNINILAYIITLIFGGMYYCIVETLEFTSNSSIQRNELDLKLKAVKGTNINENFYTIYKIFFSKYKVIDQEVY